ncbi:type I methionyl aminopeptidase [Candidatus Gracilibacteria bacterium]|nr:type I methionyl aminopeptidase [Candidatus Gracilibacteria bacterium]
MAKKKGGIKIKTPAQIKAIREGGKILAKIHDEVGKMVKPGVSTFQLNKLAEELCEKYNVIPSFKGYGGFPAVLCTSLNDIVVHGVPSKKDVLENGDILKIDCGIYQQGVHSDSCRTYVVGKNSEAEHLSKVVKQAMLKGIKQAVPGNRIGDIENAVQKTIQRAGYCPIRDFTGHGVGAELHEEPEILNYGKKGTGPLIKEGMVLAIEPMATNGKQKHCYILEDGWSAVAKDYAIGAQWEHSVLITKDGPELLTGDFDLKMF